MTYYPLNLAVASVTVAPLFGDALTGAPHIFDFTAANPRIDAYDAADFDAFQALIFDELAEAGKQWGIGRYLEDRRRLLTPYPQMTDEGRCYHVGLDIVVPEGVPLYAPLPGVVYEAGFDAGLGNYGGYVKLRHDIGGTVFYSLYGHLAVPHGVAAGAQVEAGTSIGRIGGGAHSGGWYTHTHLQVITARAEAEGRGMQGYVTAEDLCRIEDLFPTPYPLFVT